MRFRKIDRYLVLLAGLFVVAILKRESFPGEEVLPDLYRATIHRPLLAQATEVAARREIDWVRLRSERDAAQREVERLRGQVERTRELSEFLGAMRWRAAPRAIPGWVTSVETNTFRRGMSVDLGSRDGVAAGMPVVTGRALLGVVSQARRRLSAVRRLDDPGSVLDVEIEAGDRTVAAIAHGDGDAGLTLLFVRDAGELTPGMRVFTSSYDPFIPAGLLVGRIASVTDLERDGIPEVRVTPAAALESLAQVEILQKPERR